MPHKKSDDSKLLLKILGIFAIAVTVGAVMLFITHHSNKPAGKAAPVKVLRPIRPQRLIDYSKLRQDDALKQLMQKRKAEYGLKKGIDIITKSNESLKIGDTTVSMKEIEDLIRLKSGDIIEKDLQPANGKSNENISVFGIYVVRPKDNIWNIHFKFLKDYFAHKNINLSPLADEPLKGQRSSGIGKILKFSEHTVNIYNIKERKLDIDLNLIYPLNKLVVYNMTEIFKLLDRIDYKHVNRIQFDGETLWVEGE